MRKIQKIRIHGGPRILKRGMFQSRFVCTCASKERGTKLKNMGKAVAKSAKRAWRKLDVSATEVRRTAPFAARRRGRGGACTTVI
jgi:hypothetical protein